MRAIPLVLLAACSGGTSVSGTCSDADALASGAIEATVDGAAWAGQATYSWAGESLQVNTGTADGWRFTFVARTDPEGATVAAAVDAGAFPIEVDLADAGGGWALGYPESGSSYSTDEAGGTFTVTGQDGDEVLACFSFSAATESGDALEVADGAVRAVPLGR